MANKETINSHFRTISQALEWQPSYQQMDQLVALQELLFEWNRRVNLTRLIEGKRYWIGQVFDSLWPIKSELKRPDLKLKCIDIGTGCGFPGLAVAIALPRATCILVDSVRRKTSALEKITQELGLSSRVKIRTQRAELIGQDATCRGMFDLAMARAVAIAPIVVEYLVPLIKVNGEALIYKGKWSPKDEVLLLKALNPLKAHISKVERLYLPADLGIRHQIRVKASDSCPKVYPRTIGIPAKNPLGT